MLEYLDADLINSKNACIVPFENYCFETEKYIQMFENFLSTSRNEFTSEEMIMLMFQEIKTLKHIQLKLI